MLQNSLFYTALSRAQKRCIVVGSSRAVSRAVNNVQLTQRHTLLHTRLRATER
jgi:exodeoxyribonuclease V alpha subunit